MKPYRTSFPTSEEIREHVGPRKGAKVGLESGSKRRSADKLLKEAEEDRARTAAWVARQEREAATREEFRQRDRDLGMAPATVRGSSTKASVNRVLLEDKVAIEPERKPFVVRAPLEWAVGEGGWEKRKNIPVVPDAIRGLPRYKRLLDEMRGERPAPSLATMAAGGSKSGGGDFGGKGPLKGKVKMPEIPEGFHKRLGKCFFGRLPLCCFNPACKRCDMIAPTAPGSYHPFICNACGTKGSLAQFVAAGNSRGRF